MDMKSVKNQYLSTAYFAVQGCHLLSLRSKELSPWKQGVSLHYSDGNTFKKTAILFIPCNLKSQKYKYIDEGTHIPCSAVQSLRHISIPGLPHPPPSTSPTSLLTMSARWVNRTKIIKRIASHGCGIFQVALALRM